MKLETTTRALLIACFAAAPLLGGADGGCGSDDRVSIGGDDDAGSTPSRVPCGPTHCAAGQVCCNASCGICTAPDEGCITIGCVDPCAAQDAAGVGACELHLGYRWNGSTCEPLGGCSCEGAACAGLFTSREECASRHSNCGGDGGACEPQDRAIVDYLAQHRACSSRSDCRTVTIGCSELIGSCPGAVYTNEDVDDAQVAQLQSALNACATGDPGTGCGVCAIGIPEPDCIDGVCAATGSVGACAAEEQTFVDYLRANTACSVDSDCQLVNACETAAAQDCTGSFYGNRQIDEATAAGLRATLDACRGGHDCTVCLMISPPPACIDGRCAPGQLDACPAQAASCPASCRPMQAQAYDGDAGCLGPTATIGCTSDTSGTDDIVCARRAADGALFLGSSSSSLLKPGNGWERCTDAEAQSVGSAPACP